MKTFALWFGCLVLVCAGPLAAPVAAQPSASGDAAAVALLPPSTPADSAESMAPSPAAHSERLDGLWGTDLLLGLPTGFRAYRYLFRSEHQGIAVEGYAGLYLFGLMGGGGLRWRLECSLGSSNALTLGPGVGVFYLVGALGPFAEGNNQGTGVVSADLELAWQHYCGGRVSGQLGIKVGCGVPLDPENAGTIPAVPLVGIFGGFQY